jgi:guanidinopropionase
MDQHEPDAIEIGSRYLYYVDPPTFLRCSWDTDPAHADIALIGVPWAGGNPVEREQYLGPRAVRCVSAGYHRAHREFRLDPFAQCRINDLGDVPVAMQLDPRVGIDGITAFFARVAAAGARPVSVGGDHSVTLPILRAIAGAESPLGGPLAVVHFDSHTDSYAPEAGVMNAGVGFRVGVEEGLIDAEHSVQIGINGPMGDLGMDSFSAEAGYRVITLDEFEELGVAGTVAEIQSRVGDTPVYVSFDLDVLDLPWAPGVADPEVGGLTIREALKVIRGMRGLQLVGADLVCMIPRKDGAGEVTAFSAAALMHELVTMIVLARSPALVGATA